MLDPYTLFQILTIFFAIYKIKLFLREVDNKHKWTAHVILFIATYAAYFAFYAQSIIFYKVYVAESIHWTFMIPFGIIAYYVSDLIIYFYNKNNLTKLYAIMSAAFCVLVLVFVALFGAGSLYVLVPYSFLNSALKVYLSYYNKRPEEEKKLQWKELLVVGGLNATLLFAVLV